MRITTKVRAIGTLNAVCIVVLSLCIWCAPSICQTVQTLDYEDLVAKALLNSHDIKISKLDIDISRSSLSSAYALYYPTINTRWNSEYARDLTDGTAQIDVIGNTVLVQNTMYRSSFSINGNYNLFDFGATTSKVSIASKDVDVKKYIYKQFIRDTKLRILRIYSDLFTVYEELEAKEALLKLYKELCLIKERLYSAGKISKIDVADEAIRTIRTTDERDALKLKQSHLLKDLSFFTGEKYDADSLEIKALIKTESDETNIFNFDNTPEGDIVNSW